MSEEPKLGSIPAEPTQPASAPEVTPAANPAASSATSPANTLEAEAVTPVPSAPAPVPAATAAPTPAQADKTDTQIKRPQGMVVPSLASAIEVTSPNKPAPMQGPRVALVVDDEPANRDFLIRLLEQAKMQVYGASTAEETMKLIEKIDHFTLIAVDNKLPDVDGVQLLGMLHQRYPNARMVMATMLDERSLMTKAFDNGCDVFLVKPHGFMELFRRLQVLNLTGDDQLNRLIIDQYGPRPYRG